MPVPISALANAFNLLKSLGGQQQQANVLNRVTAPIPPETQRGILQATPNPGSFRPGLAGLGQLGQQALGTVAGIAGSQQPKQAEAAPIPTETPKQQAEPEEKKTDLSWLQYAIPAITAGIGTAFPGTLPMAAGFQEGLVGETTRQRDIEQKEASVKKAEEDKKEESFQKEATKRADAIFGSNDFQKPPSAVEYQFMIDALLKQLKGEPINTQYPLGETIEEGGKQYRIIGYHPDGEPALKEVGN